MDKGKIIDETDKWFKENRKNRAVFALLGEDIDGGASYYSMNFNGDRELLCQMFTNSFRLHPEIRKIADLALKATELSKLMDNSKKEKRKIQQSK